MELLKRKRKLKSSSQPNPLPLGDVGVQILPFNGPEVRGNWQYLSLTLLVMGTSSLSITKTERGFKKSLSICVTFIVCFSQ